MISMLVMEHERITTWIMRVSSMIYANPESGAACAAAPVTGLGMQTAILVLVIYNQFTFWCRVLPTDLSAVEPGVLGGSHRNGK
ncbi:MAG: hypothetical protein ACLUD0_00240 [Eubacterium ramulus]